MLPPLLLLPPLLSPVFPLMLRLQLVLRLPLMLQLPQGMVSLPSVVLIPTVQNSGIPEDGLNIENERVLKNTEKMCKYADSTLYKFNSLFTLAGS